MEPDGGGEEEGLEGETQPANDNRIMTISFRNILNCNKYLCSCEGEEEGLEGETVPAIDNRIMIKISNTANLQ